MSQENAISTANKGIRTIEDFLDGVSADTTVEEVENALSSVKDYFNDILDELGDDDEDDEDDDEDD
jgi:hypothetical protein